MTWRGRPNGTDVIDAAGRTLMPALVEDLARLSFEAWVLFTAHTKLASTESVQKLRSRAIGTSE